MVESKMWIEDYDETRKGLYFLDENGKKRILVVYEGDWSNLDFEYIPIEVKFKDERNGLA